jgi:hypothetical protein
MPVINGEFEVGNMGEDTIAELSDGGKLAHATVRRHAAVRGRARRS